MNIGRCFNEALEVYQKNIAQLVAGAFLFHILSLVSLSILTGPLAGGWALMTVNAMRREDKYVDLSDMFKGFQCFFRLAGVFYLTFIPILLGAMLCMVPGLLLMTIWVFCFFLIMDRNEGIFSSLSTSQEIVQRSGFGNYFLLVFLLLIIGVGPSAIPYAGLVLGWFVTPLVWLVEAAAYLQEVDEKKPPAKPSPGTPPSAVT